MSMTPPSPTADHERDVTCNFVQFTPGHAGEKLRRSRVGDATPPIVMPGSPTVEASEPYWGKPLVEDLPRHDGTFVPSPRLETVERISH